MTEGPGKYDEITTTVRETTQAAAVIVIILGGNQGSGFSIQSVGEDVTYLMPKLLRNLADEVESDLKRRAS